MYLIVVLNDYCAWQVFFAGYCVGEETALAQLEVFQKAYPDRIFKIVPKQ